ncbi:hypothetical protein BDV34DRAFT_200964 [Aspergillus parasiticus]|uniref:Uncharacterized protein n=1 Tax=Aspergillus parasiticus TaxID=5067 RepID=A0A5N6DAZ9_ASPPA|nr:hypothetical protein BDV34DRAFT_200964 [Aspergillus parasiticus]
MHMPCVATLLFFPSSWSTRDRGLRRACDISLGIPGLRVPNIFRKALRGVRLYFYSIFFYLRTETGYVLQRLGKASFSEYTLRNR